MSVCTYCIIGLISASPSAGLYSGNIHQNCAAACPVLPESQQTDKQLAFVLFWGLHQRGCDWWPGPTGKISELGISHTQSGHTEEVVLQEMQAEFRLVGYKMFSLLSRSAWRLNLTTRLQLEGPALSIVTHTQLPEISCSSVIRNHREQNSEIIITIIIIIIIRGLLRRLGILV